MLCLISQSTTLVNLNVLKFHIMKVQLYAPVMVYVLIKINVNVMNIMDDKSDSNIKFKNKIIRYRFNTNNKCQICAAILQS
jgi:hypothetical protein